MNFYTVKFRLCNSPEIIRYWSNIYAFDMGDASYQFVKNMKSRLGFCKDAFEILDIPQETRIS